MKHFQGVYKSDLQAVKIRLGHFLEIGDFFGINTDLRINPNSIPYPVL